MTRGGLVRSHAARRRSPRSCCRWRSRLPQLPRPTRSPGLRSPSLCRCVTCRTTSSPHTVGPVVARESVPPRPPTRTGRPPACPRLERCRIARRTRPSSTEPPLLPSRRCGTRSRETEPTSTRCSSPSRRPCRRSVPGLATSRPALTLRRAGSSCSTRRVWSPTKVRSSLPLTPESATPPAAGARVRTPRGAATARRAGSDSRCRAARRSAPCSWRSATTTAVHR